ncbi:MAG: 2-succinyl-5-enolpyruvyl-6-hydroxy-3-cyclohexene-1-carboxylic-acid synthase [Bacteroidetes bacterium]|nr:MAG: 2-succinyl-5-enolpyruvyl-6-hydroxy-3-cyclohexene-1-carboxylic-acid synthase [Bacteroidota bacterium]
MCQKYFTVSLPLRGVFEAIDNLVNQLHYAGVKNVVVCPGSRNAPLSISFTRSGLFSIDAIPDERSAGFVAMGRAIRSESPVALLCTSGSALTNFYPAVVEAFYQRVPLIVISADRPAALIDRWDGQTIRQEALFGSHVKASLTTPEDYGNPEVFGEIAAQAVQRALSAIPGPVHINVPLQEPLYPSADRPFAKQPSLVPSVSSENQQVQFPDLTGKKVFVLRGFSLKQGRKADAYPAQYADLMSGFAESPVPEQLFMLDNAALKEAMQADVLLSDGAAVLPKALKAFLRNHPPKEHYHFSEQGDVADPFFTSPQRIPASLDEFLAKEQVNWNTDYAQAWTRWSDEMNQHLAKFWEDQPYGEFTATRSFLNTLEDNSVLHVANSMPVRYASFSRARAERVYCNRGTSGIDGCVSTAVGMAASDTKTHFLLIGDVAFFYDSNALWNHIAKSNLKIVLQNNGGGGIFRLIDGPAKQPELELVFETAHSRNAEALCANLGCAYIRAENEEELESGLASLHAQEGPVVMEVFTNKLENQSFFNQYKQYIHAVKISLGNPS